ncbi:vitamin K epoxide reductase family protein [Streptomyces sp. BI20]|uniref:vitamin K epoxide reductase family protein n=1 Tax=Streptomyces sp. BI20 TaxID=3403460 RepID=UPI003C71E89D
MSRSVTRSAATRKRSGAVAPSPGPAVPRALAWLVLVGGALGTLSSGVLAHDQIKMLQDPLFVPGCNVNAVLSCGDVMNTWQSHVLGTPNALFGIAGFAALAALGAALVAGAVLPRPVWLGVRLGVSAGALFTAWLITQCVFAIGALCPWCMVVWAVMIPLAWYVNRELSGPESILRVLPHWLVPAVAYAAVVGLLLAEFGGRLFA